MASFDVIGNTTTEEVRGGNKVVKVREFHVLSLPSETYFEFRRDSTTPGFTNPKPSAQQFADRIEGVLALPNVVDVDYFQDTTAAGQLRDMMRTFYSTPNGAVQGSVEQKLADFGPGKTAALVNAEIAAGGDMLGG